MNQPKAASELSKKAFSDQTKYDPEEIGFAQIEEIEKGLRECIELHRPIIDEPEFCIVFVLAKDPLIPNLTRRKFYAWPYLPKPRPNQSVFLYNKGLDVITKRLWVMPRAEVMAELASCYVTDELSKRQQAWCVAFFEGKFWEYIRYEHEIEMLSESEYLHVHRNELIQAGCQVPTTKIIEPFDFGKIQVKQFEDPQKTIFK